MATQKATLVDRLWLWGMPFNALQKTADFGRLGWAESTLTVEQAMAQTGIRNVYMAGGFEIDETSLAVMQSAQRIVCKWSMHKHVDDGQVIDYERCEERLLAAKRLATQDTRIEGFLLDDFSTGTMNAGVRAEHLARLQYYNATHGPHLPLFATIYPMSLEREGLTEMLRYFDQLILPAWHVAEIEKFPQWVKRCHDLSGNKPVLACLYLFDFGGEEMLTRDQMQQQLDVVEPLLRGGQVTGLLVLGTCMMDLGWESVNCLHEWINRVGHDPVAGLSAAVSCTTELYNLRRQATISI